MSILFGALLIVMILLPGIIFRASYLNTVYSRKLFRSSFSDELLFSFVPALMIQMSGYGFVELFFQNVNESLFYLLLINNEKAMLQIFTEKSVFLFGLYCIATYAASWILGALARKIVLKYGLDIKYPILRMHNEWYYIFSGLILSFPNQFGTFGKASIIWLDVLVDCKEGNIIYSGNLGEYILSKDDGLDRIYLTIVERKFLKDNSMVSLDGDYLVIPYREILNINVEYYTLERSDS